MAELPILNLKVAEQRYSCHSCAGCCRDFTVQLFTEDREKLDAQHWEHELREKPYIEYKGAWYLRQQADGACIFLQKDGLCGIHARHGLTAKPIACQMFPFSLVPAAGGLQVGMSFACPSALGNHGDVLDSHLRDIRRLGSKLVKAHILEGNLEVRLKGALRASGDDVNAVSSAISGLMMRVDQPMRARLEACAWFTARLREANLENMRGGKFVDLVTILANAAFDELELSEDALSLPTNRQMRQLRQCAFAHVEDVKIREIQEHGARRTAFGQFRRNFQFGRGRGIVHNLTITGWPKHLAPLEAVGEAGPASESNERIQIDFLLTRYVRTRVLGGRCWGLGYYEFDIVTGLEALWLLIAATGWLARWHAASHHRTVLAFDDVKAALLRTDRAAGRAPWLGAAGERLRLKYLGLAQPDGLRNLVRAMAMTTAPSAAIDASNPDDYD